MDKKKIKAEPFSTLPVDKDILAALEDMGITHPTEIQAATIPLGLEGADVIGRAKTGSGKTLAFGIPILQELRKTPGRGVKAVVLCPTRELAKQVDEEILMAGKATQLKTAVIYGGVGYEPQFEALKVADIVVGTPGRIIDHLDRGTLNLDGIEFFVLDEADRMLDMGFIDDIKRIINKTPPHKQSFFFSATMPLEIRELASSFMRDPKYAAMEDVYVSSTLLEEWYVDCGSLFKVDMLAEILRREKPHLALIFVNSRLFTDKIAEYLERQGFNAKALHGGHAQNKREQIVDDFESTKVQVLTATDVAARGLDIEDISHVINYDVPRDVQTYTHRIGRTARAGKKGKAITLLDREEHGIFSRIEGDSLRNIHRYPMDYRPKKVYLLPRSDNGEREPRRGFSGPRRGSPQGNRRGPRRGDAPHRSGGGFPRRRGPPRPQ